MVLPRPVLDRDVLPGEGVPVLQAAVADAVALQVQRPQHAVDRFQRAERPFRQAIQRERSPVRHAIGEFLDDEIFRAAFEFHGAGRRRSGCAWRGLGRARNDCQAQPDLREPAPITIWDQAGYPVARRIEEALDMNAWRITDDQVAAFARDGYLVARGLLDAVEVDALVTTARRDYESRQQVAARGDGEGGAIRLVVENDLGNDIYGAIVRSRRIVSAMERVLGDEVYHYHHKMILKEPFTGGAWLGTRITATGTTTGACCPTWPVV